jgi:hypothetical protein
MPTPPVFSKSKPLSEAEVAALQEARAAAAGHLSDPTSVPLPVGPAKQLPTA